jgi:serine/threonine protein kinase
LLRRLLQADPAERITVSEIFNHSWVRTASSTQFIDLFHQFQQQQQQQQHQTATTSSLSPMVSGVTTPAAGFDSVASSLSPSLKVRDPPPHLGR